MPITFCGWAALRYLLRVLLRFFSGLGVNGHPGATGVKRLSSSTRDVMVRGIRTTLTDTTPTVHQTTETTTDAALASRWHPCHERRAVEQRVGADAAKVTLSVGAAAPPLNAVFGGRKALAMRPTARKEPVLRISPWLSASPAIASDVFACSFDPSGPNPYEQSWAIAWKLAAVIGLAAACALWLRKRGVKGVLTQVPLVILVLHPAWTVPATTDCGLMRVILGVPATVLAAGAAVIGICVHLSRQRRRRTSACS